MTPSPTGDLGDESQQFGLLVNSVTDYAIYMLDPQGSSALGTLAENVSKATEGMR